MYILATEADATGAWFRVLVGGDYTVANGAADSLGGGTLKIQTADLEENLLAMPTAATSTDPFASQTLTLARDTLVRADLSGATTPDCSVFLQHQTIQSPTLKLQE